MQTQVSALQPKNGAPRRNILAVIASVTSICFPVGRSQAQDGPVAPLDAASITTQPTLRFDFERSPDFFTQPEICAFLNTQSFVSTHIDDTALAHFIEREASKHLPPQVVSLNEGSSATEKFDHFSDFWLTHESAPVDGPLPELIAKGTFLANSETTLTRKCLALLCFSKPGAGDSFLISVLGALSQRSQGASLALAQIAFLSSEEPIAALAIKQIAHGDPSGEEELKGTRAKLEATRLRLTEDHGSALAHLLLTASEDGTRSFNQRLVVLISRVNGLNTANLQRRLDADWDLKFTAWADAVIKHERRQDPLKNPDLLIEQAPMFGARKGTRNVDYIPVGAEVMGVVVYYDADIKGIRLVYRGEEGFRTPLRGSDKAPFETFITALNGEIIQEMKMFGRDDVGSVIGVKTNFRTYHVLAGGIYYHEWGEPLEPQKFLHGSPELDSANRPVAIGLVTYSDNERVRAFALIRQYGEFPGDRPSRAEFMRRYGRR